MTTLLDRLKEIDGKATSIVGPSKWAILSRDDCNEVLDALPQLLACVEAARALNSSMNNATLYTESGDEKYDSGWGVKEMRDDLTEALAPLTKEGAA